MLLKKAFFYNKAIVNPALKIGHAFILDTYGHFNSRNTKMRQGHKHDWFAWNYLGRSEKTLSHALFFCLALFAASVLNPKYCTVFAWHFLLMAAHESSCSGVDPYENGSKAKKVARAETFIDMAALASAFFRISELENQVGELHTSQMRQRLFDSS